MTHRPFDPAQAAPAHACATGIDRTLRAGSLCMPRFVVATQSLA